MVSFYRVISCIVWFIVQWHTSRVYIFIWLQSVVFWWGTSHAELHFRSAFFFFFFFKDGLTRSGGVSARAVWRRDRLQEAPVLLSDQQSRGSAGLAAGHRCPVTAMRPLQSPASPRGAGVLPRGHVSAPQEPPRLRVPGSWVQRSVRVLGGAPLTVPGGRGADTRAACTGSGGSYAGHWLVWHRWRLGDGGRGR